MGRKTGITGITVLILVTLLAAYCPVGAQGGADGTANYALNMRAGPGMTYSVITILPPGTGMVFEARNEDAAWLLGRTEDGGFRGWVASLYLSYRDGFAAVNLPLSDEVVAAPPPAAPAPVGGESAAPLSTGPDPSAAVLAHLPIVPTIGPRAREIFIRGQGLGNNPRVFTIVGGCNSLARGFMMPFGIGVYNLGPYGHLQATIDWFFTDPVDGTPNSFTHKGVACRTGYTAPAVLDPMWSDPGPCQSTESPLECEYRRSRPSVALIMLGLLDVYWYSTGQYEAAMRQIVEVSIENGVIPVLTTFPTATGTTVDEYSGLNDFTVRARYRAEFNAAIVRVANEYGVPLMNFWRAAQALPRSGFRENDFIHLLEPDDPASWANLGNPQSVFAVWNLAALQTLDALRTAVLAG